MNSKILNDIYYGELKPWLINFGDERELKEAIRAVSKMPFASLGDYESRLKVLLQKLPALQKSFTASALQLIQPLTYATPLPEPSTMPQHFYKNIIDAETKRYYNETLNNPFLKDFSLDVPYQIGGKSLKGIAILANELNNELLQLEFNSNDLTYFTLLYLRNSLIALYFSIQDPFKEHLSDVFENIKDFYLYKMDNDTDTVELKKLSFDKSNKPIVNTTIPIIPPSLSFGGRIANKDNLLALFDDLCVDITFLDEEKTSVATLVDFLLTKEIVPGAVNIYLACQTTEFVFIIDNLGKLFTKLNQTNIEKSKSFWTKEEHNKLPALITSTNFSKTRAKSKMKEEKKTEILDTISKYFP